MQRRRMTTRGRATPKPRPTTSPTRRRGRLGVAVRAPDRRRGVPLQAPLAGRDDLGEATYAVMIKPGEEIIAGSNERFLVIDVVPFAEEDESPFVGMLKVERA
jgi:hypothetical protein